MAKATPKTKTFVIEGKECVLREPGFPELSLGLSAMTAGSGSMDMAGSGKAIFDTCKIECDKGIEDNPKFLFSLCLKIAEIYISPVEVEIKKN